MLIIIELSHIYLKSSDIKERNPNLIPISLDCEYKSRIKVCLILILKRSFSDNLAYLSVDNLILLVL
jgi:hypothetical protein